MSFRVFRSDMSTSDIGFEVFEVSEFWVFRLSFRVEFLASCVCEFLFVSGRKNGFVT